LRLRFEFTFWVYVLGLRIGFRFWVLVHVTKTVRFWITAGGAEKSQQCHKYFLQYSKFSFERTQIWP